MSRDADASIPRAFVRPELRRLPPLPSGPAPCRHKLDQNEVPWDLPRRFKERVARRVSSRPTGPAIPTSMPTRCAGTSAACTAVRGRGCWWATARTSCCRSAADGPGRARAARCWGPSRASGSTASFVLKAGGVPALPAAAARPAAADRTSSWPRSSATPRAAAPLLAEQPDRRRPAGRADRAAAWSGWRRRSCSTTPTASSAARTTGRSSRAIRNLFLFRTFSKAWSLAGLRLGYLLADPRLVAELIKVKLPYNLGHAGGGGRAGGARSRRRKRGGGCALLRGAAGRSGRACWPRKGSRSSRRRRTSCSSAARRSSGAARGAGRARGARDPGARRRGVSGARGLPAGVGGERARLCGRTRAGAARRSGRGSRTPRRPRQHLRPAGEGQTEHSRR